MLATAPLSKRSTMSIDHSVSLWIDQLRDGESAAAGQLWNRYYLRLIGLARKKLGSAPRRVADEEDVVAEAFASFCTAAENGRFPSLQDRHDFWHLIVRITERKAYDNLRAQMRQKRGGGKVFGESVLWNADNSHASGGLDDFADRGPSPDFAAFAAEAVQDLLGCLNDDLREIALLKLEGYINKEIAEKLDCSAPTIERRLNLIRKILADKLHLK
jgi:RNA polymerase sigma factor (sigma-70 family)